MHSYVTDESRIRAYGVIAVAAVAVSWLLVKALAEISWPEWLVSVPSVAGSFALLYGLFDRVLWRLKVVRAVRLSITADVSGTYEGALTSTYRGSDGERVSHPVRIVVQQTWTKLCVTMSVGPSSRMSNSTSYMAFVSHEGHHARLGYCYRNKTNPGVADEDMGDHDGAADVSISPDGKLHGRYFNSRPRSGSLDARLVTVRRAQAT